MTNYDKKEDTIVEKILLAVEKLDTDLDKIDALDEDHDKKHEIKKWFEEKKAVHQIKKILHDEKKYEKYDAKELEKAEKYFNSFFE